MKWMIASDLHGSAYYCRALLQAWDREQADRLILLGDLLYHGPRNDLPREYAPKEVLAMLNQRKEGLLCVRGNCDSEVDQMVLAFPILADYGVLALGGRLLYLTHGHVFQKDHLPPLQAGDILLHGHTHIPGWETLEEGRQCWNPGSVALPKAGSPLSYMILEGAWVQWKDLSGGEVCDVHQGLVHADAPDDGGPAAAQQNLSAGQGAGQTVPIADGEHGHLGGALGHKRQPVSGAGAGGQGFDRGHPGMEGENRTQRRRSRVPILLGAEQAVESDPDPGVVP